MKNTDYHPQKIEPKWQKIWLENKTYQPDLKNPKKPYYNLMMFPYPSAEGLHVGNMYAFTGSDVWGRFMRMQGYDVFEPIGLDGFGIHSENYAIKIGKHPADQAKISQKNFYRQLSAIGNQFSWNHRLETYDPDYYQWTQWIFIKLFKAGLAYRKKSPVNWCPSCKTVLADEQVVNGRCERCETEVTQKKLTQWFFRITDYADRLLNNTNKIDWSPKVLTAQRHWIAKKEGININYNIVDSKDRVFTSKITGRKTHVKTRSLQVTCFTSRPDTNFGATFVVLAPEHPIVAVLLKLKIDIKKYIKRASKISKEERIAQAREKTGVFTGLYALNPLTNKKMPIWISDFVLMDVGTGAVVGVPGHDKRDFEFAQKFNLPVIRVVVGPDQDKSVITKAVQIWEGEGTVINSQFLDRLKTNQAKQKIMDYLEEKGWGKRKTIYHLRDWLISRQRYWGPPIPMVYCSKCANKHLGGGAPAGGDSSEVKKQMPGWFPIPEKDLPVKLPYVKDYRPKSSGRGPLEQLFKWVKVKCPKCQGPAKRETDVSDTFLDSAWYFLRYPSIKSKSAKNTSEVEGKEKAWDHQITRQWLPVDMYIGGAEHSVLHLLYSRFLTMVFKDLGYLHFEEPFSKFRAHGLIIKDGAKMSKSKGNVVNPDEYIKKYGADALRCYLMFLGPLKDGGDFKDTGMKGMHKFLSRIFRLVVKKSGKDTSEKELYFQHKTIKRVSEGIKRLKYNVSIAAIMEYVNFLQSQKQVSLESLKTLVLLLAPFAPHMSEELWQSLKDPVFKRSATSRASVRQTGSSAEFHSIHSHPWPKFNPKFIKQDTIELVIQINGKVRDKIKIKEQKTKSKDEVLKLAKTSKKIQNHLQGKTIKKVIFIKGKLINLVV